MFITDDMGVVAEIADGAVVMWKGEKAEEGEAAAGPEHPRAPVHQGAVAPCRGSVDEGLSQSRSPFRADGEVRIGIDLDPVRCCCVTASTARNRKA